MNKEIATILMRIFRESFFWKCPITGGGGRGLSKIAQRLDSNPIELRQGEIPGNISLLPSHPTTQPPRQEKLMILTDRWR